MVLPNPPKQEEIKKEIKLEIKEESPDLVLSNPPNQEEIKKEIKHEIKEEGEISDSDDDISIVHVIENKPRGKPRQFVANQKMLSIGIDGQNATTSQNSEGTCAVPSLSISINNKPCCPQDPCGDCNLCRPALQKQKQNQELMAEAPLFNPLLVTAKLANNLWPVKTESQNPERNTELKAGYFDTRIGKWQPIWQNQSQNQLISGQNQLTSGQNQLASGQNQLTSCFQFLFEQVRFDHYFHLFDQDLH